MALRDQPYFPLYVQDYMTDEKLNMCCWATQGIYIKILCVLHKQESYGSILLKQISKQTSKQTSKQNLSKVEFFASILIRQIPCQLQEMINALTELIDFDVLQIDEAGLHQKRMVRDGLLSDTRSKSGKKGGENSLGKRKILLKQKSKQNTEYEYEDEYEDESINKKEKRGMGKKEKEDEILIDVPEDFQPIVRDWLEYKKSRKESYKSQQSIRAFTNKLLKLSAGNPETAKQIIEQSLANNWAGIFELKDNDNTSKKNNSISQDYKRSIYERLQSACGTDGL